MCCAGWQGVKVFAHECTGRYSEITWPTTDQELLSRAMPGVLLETNVWTAARGACSGRSKLIKIFNNSRYRGYR